LWNCDFNSFNFKNSRNLVRHKCKIPDDDEIELSKHVGVYIIYIDTVVILIVHLLVVIKTTTIRSNSDFSVKFWIFIICLNLKYPLHDHHEIVDEILAKNSNILYIFIKN
jgi:hypothetical protein